MGDIADDEVDRAMTYDDLDDDGDFCEHGIPREELCNLCRRSETSPGERT